MEDDIRTLVGLARKGNMLVLGEEAVTAALQGHKARLVLLARDLRAEARERIRRLGGEGNCPVLELELDKSVLGPWVGISVCAAMAFTDVGLAAAVVRKLAQGAPPGRYDALLLQMERKAERTVRRRREKRARQRRQERAARKPWAASPKRREKEENV